jgi:hypothetical protein
MKKMFVRFLCNWPPYRDGACIEVLDRFGSHFVARCMAELVTAADVREYNRTMAEEDRAVARAVDKHFNAMSRTFKTAGRRVISDDQWRAGLGADRSGYQQARQAYISKRLNVPGYLAAITVRSI